MFQLPPLRDYQLDVDSQLCHVTENTTIQMDTGTGKSLVMMHQALRRVQNGETVLFVVPRIELIRNLEKYIIRHAPLIYKNFYSPINKKIGRFERGKRLYIGTFGSIGQYRHDFSPDCVIHDEGHHLRARTWEEIVTYWDNAIHLAFTATPIRYDGKSLQKLFPKLIVSRPTDWFIKNGYLAPFECYTDPKAIIFSSDLRIDELGKQQSLYDKKELVGDVAKTWHRLAKGKQTIVFATGEEHANHLAEQYGKDVARVITGKMSDKEREKNLKDFENRMYPVSSNVQILTEGVDVPCECVQLARFTYSFSLYRQMIGRALRYAPGKTAIIIDHAGNLAEHGTPDFPIDWEELYYSQEIETEIENFDKNTLQYTCGMCFAPLISLGEFKGSATIDCPHCGYANVFRNLTTKQRQMVGVDESVNLVKFDLGIVEQKIARILVTSKMTHQAKIKRITQLEAPLAMKEAALQKLGVEPRLIKVILR